MEFRYSNDPVEAIEQWARLTREAREAQWAWEKAYAEEYAKHPNESHEVRSQLARSAALLFWLDMFTTDIDATKAAAWVGQVTGNKYLFAKTQQIVLP